MGKEYFKEAIKFHTEEMKHFATLAALLGTIFFSLSLGENSIIKIAGNDTGRLLTSYFLSLIFFVLSAVLCWNARKKTLGFLGKIKELEESEKKEKNE